MIYGLRILPFLETIIQQFGDVMTADEALAALEAG